MNIPSRDGFLARFQIALPFAQGVHLKAGFKAVHSNSAIWPESVIIKALGKYWKP